MASRVGLPWMRALVRLVALSTVRALEMGPVVVLPPRALDDQDDLLGELREALVHNKNTILQRLSLLQTLEIGWNPTDDDVHAKT